MSAVPLKFQIGARTLVAVPRELERVAIDLAGATAALLPSLPALPGDSDGYLVTSLAQAREAEMIAAAPGFLPYVRQRYERYHTDLAIGFDAFHAGLSGNARSQLKRKSRRIAAASGGTLRIERFASPVDLARFYPLARLVSETTYQERLMAGGLPAAPGFVHAMLAAAATDRARGWLLWVGATPAAYLYCEARADAPDLLCYDHVGHDPAFADYSPGSVLMLEAFRDLMAERRFVRFDFTTGEGRHKRQFASASTPCLDLLLLRPTVVNRAVAEALGGFDRLADTARRAAAHPALQGLARRVRRAA